MKIHLTSFLIILCLLFTACTKESIVSDESKASDNIFVSIKPMVLRLDSPDEVEELLDFLNGRISETNIVEADERGVNQGNNLFANAQLTEIKQAVESAGYPYFEAGHTPDSYEVLLYNPLTIMNYYFYEAKYTLGNIQYYFRYYKTGGEDLVIEHPQKGEMTLDGITMPVYGDDYSLCLFKQVTEDFRLLIRASHVSTGKQIELNEISFEGLHLK